jgi:hypothetical protein
MVGLKQVEYCLMEKARHSTTILALNNIKLKTLVKIFSLNCWRTFTFTLLSSFHISVNQKMLLLQVLDQFEGEKLCGIKHDLEVREGWLPCHRIDL